MSPCLGKFIARERVAQHKIAKQVRALYSKKQTRFRAGAKARERETRRRQRDTKGQVVGGGRGRRGSGGRIGSVLSRYLFGLKRSLHDCLPTTRQSRVTTERVAANQYLFSQCINQKHNTGI